MNNRLSVPTLHESCRHARDTYLRENGWTLEAYDAKRTEASVLGIEISVPNTSKHRWAIRLHDLHHVATGYGTDSVGEGEISAWEWSSGLSGLDLYVASIVVMGTLYGFVLAPRRIVRAWRSAKSSNLFRPGTDREASYESLLGLSVQALREHLNVPLEGLARGARYVHVHAPHQVQSAY